MSNDSHRQLHAVCDRDEWACLYCHRPLFCAACEPERARTQEKAIWATRDHIIPRSKGGWSVLANLVACCPPCNQHKADSLPVGGYPVLKIQPKRERRGLRQRLNLPLSVLERVHSLDCWVMTFCALNPGRPITEGPQCNCGFGEATG